MKNRIMLIFVLSLLLAWGSSCGNDGPRSAADAPARPSFDFGYDLKKPGETWTMPGRLEEISGLSLSPDGRYLAAVQDENGIIFFLDKATGKLTREVKFWDDGDYEGVEMVDDYVFVVKSSGTLYRVQDGGKEFLQVEKYKTFLDSRNDVEGLAYDPAGNRLLLACKGQAADPAEHRFAKAIYAFSLATLEMAPTPAYLIRLEDVQAYLETAPAIRKLEKLLDYFSLDKSEFVFSPSGLAIHPLTGDLYITSSVGKLLLVLGQDGKIRHIEKLDKDVHPQPEGICFDRDGALYIANEGRGGDGVIHRFPYRK